MKLMLLIAGLAGIAVWTESTVSGEEPARDRFAARLFVQQDAGHGLRWADVRETEKGELVCRSFADVHGFPKLDAAKQRLVQMKLAGGRVLVGVRDDDDGQFASGWVMLETGVRYQDHGDHGHWRHKDKPFVLGFTIDKEQGNPAHLYVFDDTFYLANDRKNGYSRFDPKAWYRTVGGEITSGSPRFIPGGGNHITLAVLGDVGYSCWIDGGGPNMGRVDVTPVTGSKPTIRYSFALPTGVIHGAAACCDKVFFAPADGICWVKANTRLARNAEKIQIHHLALGKNGDKPNRTGAFATHQNHVLCVTGKAALAKLVIIDARSDQPKPVFVPLNGRDGNKPVSPAIVRRADKSVIALVFHDHDRDVEADDLLDLIALDPDANGDYSDARLLKTLKVGRSAVDGHFGHHSVGFDADGKTAYFSNPGDGTICALDLKSLEIKATFKLGGNPAALVVHGGRDQPD